MIIQMLEGRQMHLPSRAKRSFPKGWSGEVPDHIGAEWVADGSAILEAAAPAAMFTPAQVAVLGAAANQILHQIAQAQVAPAPGELPAKPVANTDGTQ